MNPILLHLRRHGLFYVALILFSIFYFSGLPQVPYHPDESTQIWMSEDYTQTVTNIRNLIWSGQSPINARIRYRLIDAPITRLMIGFGRSLSHMSATRNDWNWGRSWDFNVQMGALPDPALLTRARLSVAWLFPIGLALFYHTAQRLRSRRFAWLCAALLAFNALTLLHTRRAMAESALLFGLFVFFFALTIRPNLRPFLLAAAAAFALCAKQSTAPLIVAGAVLILLDPQLPWRRRLLSLAAFLGIVALVFAALNPVFWGSPLQAANASWRFRTDLVSIQRAQIQNISPDLAINSYSDRIATMLAQLYFSVPAVADVATYVRSTQAASDLYFSNPLHILFRSFLAGIIFLTFSLFGLLLILRRIWKAGRPLASPLFWLLFTFAGLAGGLLVAVSLPYQRYSLPVLPAVLFTAAWGLDEVIALLLVGYRKIKTGRQAAVR